MIDPHLAEAADATRRHVAQLPGGYETRSPVEFSESDRALVLSTIDKLWAALERAEERNAVLAAQIP